MSAFFAPVLAVFAQGLLSFFSPCVLPLVPLYVGYLAGGARVEGPDGAMAYPRGRTVVNTLFFILGVSFAFFLLGFGFTALGRFFSGHQTLFARISGIVVILFGLYQLGLFGSSRSLSRERRLPFDLQKLAMNPLTALVMGFTFSFAWTPCVGPALTGVLLMAGSAASAGAGFALIGVYTLGFAVPFLLVGLFTATVLDFFKKHRKVMRYTVKAGGAVLVLMGIMLLTGWMNGFTAYLSRFPAAGSGGAPAATASASPAPSAVPDGAAPSAPPEIPAPDFTLTDQLGDSHTLSDYRGKTVFLNFWATWCGYCKDEMPDIQALYEKYGKNEEDLVILGVANPSSADYPRANDVSEEEVAAFLEESGYTYPTVMDYSGELLYQYGVNGFPASFLIGGDGNVLGYLPGAVTAEILEREIQRAMEAQPAE